MKYIPFRNNLTNTYYSTWQSHSKVGPFQGPCLRLGTTPGLHPGLFMIKPLSRFLNKNITFHLFIF